MRFLIDECTGPALAKWLREKQHDVYSVYEESRGMDDLEIIQKAYKENRILISNDKDFGEKVFREGHPHCGVILLRISDERAANKIKVIQNLLEHYSERILNQFVIVTETSIRFSSRTK